jgi:predicted nuclease with TOPRIM domain
MKSKLEEKVKILEKEKNTLLEEKRKLEEVVELTERASELEGEVNKLRDEVEALKDKIPKEFLQQLGDATSSRLSGENELGEERSRCEDEDLL